MLQQFRRRLTQSSIVPTMPKHSESSPLDPITCKRTISRVMMVCTGGRGRKRRLLPTATAASATALATRLLSGSATHPLTRGLCQPNTPPTLCASSRGAFAHDKGLRRPTQAIGQAALAWQTETSERRGGPGARRSQRRRVDAAQALFDLALPPSAVMLLL